MPRTITFLFVTALAIPSYGNPFVDGLQHPSKDAPTSGFYYEIAFRCGADSAYLKQLRSRQEIEYLNSAGKSKDNKQDFSAKFDSGRAEALSLWNSEKFQTESKAVTCKTVQAVAGGTFLSNPSGSEKPSRTSYNALWNDSGSAGAIGFWLYAREGKCPSIRDINPNVIAIGPAGEIAGNSATLVSVDDLSVCALLDGRRQFIKCKSASLRYNYVPAFHEYVGSYKLEFVDGTSRSGNFTAQFCPANK